MTHYDTLGVVPTASAAEIRDAYRRLARRHHPDRAAERDATAMAAINEAYRVLGDAGRRAAYDAQLRGGGVRTFTPPCRGRSRRARLPSPTCPLPGSPGSWPR